MLWPGGNAMNVSLTPQIEAMIQQRVESGRYRNASDVVREALLLLEEREQLEHLRSLLEVGLEQARRGELIEFTPERAEEIRRRAKEAYLRGDKPKPVIRVLRGRQNPAGSVAEQML
jgi:antitoxin ParD1/3/4